MTRKQVTFLTLFIAVFFCVSSARAQMTGVEGGTWLLGVIFKLEKMRDDAGADLQRYTDEIRKCNRTIEQSEKIIRLARQKGSSRAETIAGNALARARQARLKNKELKKSAALRKKQAEVALANVRNLLARQLSVNREIRSVVTGRRGRVTIFSKRRNESINLDDDRAVFLEPGDEIWTYGNSSVEMRFLDGRGTLQLGEYSRFRLEEDKPGTQIINMLKGKIYIGVEKLDEYRNMVEEKLKAYQEDASTIKDEVVRKMVDQYERKKDRWQKVKSGRYYSYGLLGPLGSTPLIRTPTCVLAERGTKFLVFEDETTGTEVTVLEGTVEVKPAKGEKTFLVGAGGRIQVTGAGVVSPPEKIDLEKITRWWK